MLIPPLAKPIKEAALAATEIDLYIFKDFVKLFLSEILTLLIKNNIIKNIDIKPYRLVIWKKVSDIPSAWNDLATLHDTFLSLFIYVF